jgi:23S rRNA pseudouridine1911/1915/1917 synthase
MAVNVENAREARTVYHVIKRYGNFTHLEVCPETGRMHQIRVHLDHLGNPVLGDSLYGRDARVGRQALHAEMIGFTHPDSSQYMEFHAPVPEDMRKFLEEAEKGKE